MHSYTTKSALQKPQDARTMVNPGTLHLHSPSVGSANVYWPLPSTPS